jgi:hypothetical protein
MGADYTDHIGIKSVKSVLISGIGGRDFDFGFGWQPAASS